MFAKIRCKIAGFAAGAAGLCLMLALPAVAADKATPAISEEASAALVNMGKTLLAKEFSFEANTIRVQSVSGSDDLHIFHTIDVTVRRPDRLQATVVGDDGTTKLFYDGKTVSLVSVDNNRYATIAVPDTIQKMMEDVMGKLHIDFPLADFLTDAPNKAFLTGVTAGRLVNTVTIDGTPCRHLIFTQPPGISLELWVEANEQSLPRRLIVTYHSLPDSPSFIALFSKWNFSAHPSDADFVFTPPAGATKMELKIPASAATAH